MPFYDYTCSQCRQEFTLRRKVDEMNEPAPCPGCGTEETQRREISLFYATNTGTSTAAASSPKTNIRHI